MISALLVAAALGYAHPEQLANTTWIAGHAQDVLVRVLDVRRAGFEGHIHGSAWLDPRVDPRCRQCPSFMLPPKTFEQVMGQLGIGNTTRVVLYDDREGLLAARVWWTLNAYGHANVALRRRLGALDGRAATVTAATRTVSTATFTARLNPAWLATVADVRRHVGASIQDEWTTSLESVRAVLDVADNRLVLLRAQSQELGPTRGAVIDTAVQKMNRTANEAPHG